MAQPLSPFDLLPDEVLLKILAETGRRRGHLHNLREHARDFLVASNVCKRWANLSFQVKELEWSLASPAEALSLVNFVQDSRVSLHSMKLFMHPSSLLDIQLPLVFNAFFKARCAAQVDVFLAETPGLLNFDTETVWDIGGLLNLLLCCRKLERLSIDARDLVDGSLTRVKGGVGQAFGIRTLALINVEISAVGLQSIWSACKELEHLCVNMLVAGPQAPVFVNLESEVMTSLCLAQSLGADFSIVTIKAPRLISLESNCNVRSLGTPLLEKLTLGLRALATLPFPLLPRLPLKHLVLKEAPGRHPEPEKCWQLYIKPLLRRLPNLETLEIARLGRSQASAMVPMDKFLLMLGPSLRTLQLTHGALHLLGHSTGALGTHTNLQNISVEIDYLGLSDFLKLLAFRKAFPSLKSVEVRCDLYETDLEATKALAAELGVRLVHKEGYPQTCDCWFC